MNTKQREAKEAIYRESNINVRSVCSGQFYKKSSKSYEQCKNCANCFKYKSYKDKKEDTPEVKFHYIDTFRKCEFYKVRPIDDNYILTTAIYNIMYVNDLACNSVTEMLDYVKDQDKETRKIYGALAKRQRTYESILSKIIPNNMDFLAEYNSQMYEVVFPKIEKLTNEIEFSLKSIGTENSKFIALAEVARTIIGYSVVNVENRVKECLKYKKNAVHLRQYKLNDMLKIAENLSCWTSRKCKALNLNKCENIMTAYRELDKVLTDKEVINEALYKAKDFYE